jgi:hypothetical protein
VRSRGVGVALVRNPVRACEWCGSVEWAESVVMVEAMDEV